MRYLIYADFRSVLLVSFSLYSIFRSGIAFDLEHRQTLARIIVVPLFYGLLFIRKKKLKGVILAHAVTNLGLGIYAIVTGIWMFR